MSVFGAKEKYADEIPRFLRRGPMIPVARPTILEEDVENTAAAEHFAPPPQTITAMADELDRIKDYLRSNYQQSRDLAARHEALKAELLAALEADKRDLDARRDEIDRLTESLIGETQRELPAPNGGPQS